MKYELNISQHNIKPHLDIERDIQLKKNGLFTFNLRVSQGNIEDYASYETITLRDYAGFELTSIEEYTVTYDIRTQGKDNAVRPGNR